MKKACPKNKISTQTYEVLKKQETETRNEFISAVERQTGKKILCDEDPQQLESYREYFYMNSLFTGAKGEKYLQAIMKSIHPGLRYDSKIIPVLRDFSKVYLQEVMENCQRIMTSRQTNQISEEIFELANWETSRDLWRS